VVLTGKSVGQVGETAIYGSKATTHIVEVEEVLKGDPGDGNLRISSMPQTCSRGGSYWMAIRSIPPKESSFSPPSRAASGE